MRLISRRITRAGIRLIPFTVALLHALDVLPLAIVTRLDNIFYDARLRAVMPHTRDTRIVIVDIDEKSLAEIGYWPWGRDKLAPLIEELHER